MAPSKCCRPKVTARMYCSSLQSSADNLLHADAAFEDDAAFDVASAHRYVGLHGVCMIPKVKHCSYCNPHFHNDLSHASRSRSIFTHTHACLHRLCRRSEQLTLPCPTIALC